VCVHLVSAKPARSGTPYTPAGGFHIAADRPAESPAANTLSIAGAASGIILALFHSGQATGDRRDDVRVAYDVGGDQGDQAVCSHAAAGAHVHASGLTSRAETRRNGPAPRQPVFFLWVTSESNAKAWRTQTLPDDPFKQSIR
jgi:hypothetical protein